MQPEEGGIIVAHGLGVQPLTVGKEWEQEHGLTGHTEPALDTGGGES